jgi:hypothetical protein
MAGSGSPVRLSPEEVERTLDDVERIGNRYHGSAGERECRDYISERFDEVGLEDVRVEPFRYLAYEHGSASCRLVGPERRELPCHAVQFSAEAEASGEAVYVGTGTAEDFERIDRLGVDLEGRVVVAHSIAPFMIAPFLAGRGVAALVNLGETPDGTIGNFTAALYRPPLAAPWPGRPVEYPAVTVEAAAGRELLSTMTAGRPVEIHVEHRGTTLEKESWNVVGRLGAGDEHALLGAHYDSQAEGPCVWDNGTGIAALIDSARVLRGAERARTIVFVAFGVEEVGLWGSTWYTVQHADELDSLVGMVNLDAIGSRYPAKPTIWTDEAMRDFAVEAAAAQGWADPIVFDARRFAFSDNSPFTDAGVPSCWPWEFPPIHPYYHSAGDVRPLVDAARVAETGAVATKIVERLATVARPALGRATAPGDPAPA